MCNAETEPSDNEDLSVLVQPTRFVLGTSGDKMLTECDDQEAEQFAVLQSSDQAEHEPDYRIMKVFDTRLSAETFAKTLQD